MKPTANSSSPRLSRRSRSGEQCPGNRDGRDKPGHDEGRGSDTLSNPAKHGHMVSCWQNGRRVLMHSSEVARMMKEQKQSPASSMKRCDALKPCMDYRVAHRQAAREDTRGPMRPGNDEEGVALVAKEPMRPAHDALKASASAGLTPPPIAPRSRALAKSKIWQKLAKEMARVAGHPKRCHKPFCRRAKRCTGGADACYLREFETVDVVMQRFLQSHARELRAAAERTVSSAGCGGAKS